MSKRTTRMGLGAAALVAVGAVAAGATASASTMADPPADKVVSASVLQLNDDGKVIVCDLEGDAASVALPETGVRSGETGDGQVAGEPIRSGAVEADLGDGDPIAVGEDGSPTGGAVDPGVSFIIGTTGADSKVIASGGPEDMRQGSDAECAAMSASAGDHD